MSDETMGATVIDSDPASAGLDLDPSRYFSERILIERLDVSRTWLRRRVGGYIAGKARIYLGADVVRALKPVRPLPALQPLPRKRTPGHALGAARPASSSAVGSNGKSLRHELDELLKQRDVGVPPPTSASARGGSVGTARLRLAERRRERQNVAAPPPASASSPAAGGGRAKRKLDELLKQRLTALNRRDEE